jgi:hypothetical protein
MKLKNRHWAQKSYFVTEIGSEEQGTWMSAAPKKSPPAHKLVRISITPNTFPFT